MKKMLTTLTAIALSVAVVSTVDAKKMPMATPATVKKEAARGELEGKKVIPATASENAAVRSVNRKVAEIQKIEDELRALQTWRGNLVSGYTAEDKLKATQMVEGLALQKAQADAEIDKLIKEQVALTKKSMFGLRSEVTDQAKYDEIETQIKGLRADSAAADAAITQQEVILSRAACDAYKAGYKAIVAIVVSIAIDKLLLNSKITNFGMEKITDAYNKIASYTPEFVTSTVATVRGKVGSAVEYGAGKASDLYQYGAGKAAAIGAGALDYGRRAGQAAGLGGYVGQTAAQQAAAAAAAEAAADAAAERAMERTMSIMQ